jgi:hypothetical protein
LRKIDTLENKILRLTIIVFATLGLLLVTSQAQDKTGPKNQAPVIAVVPLTPATPDLAASFPPIQNPATKEQIREYLQLSGDLDSFRTSWIAALDKNRSIGAPYWPESFWAAMKQEMENTNLMPVFIVYIQHGVSRDLMQEVLDTYHKVGAAHFQGTPACFKLGDTLLPMSSDLDKLNVLMTTETLERVYQVYKPEIKAARAQYLKDHPDWKD